MQSSSFTDSSNKQKLTQERNRIFALAKGQSTFYGERFFEGDWEFFFALYVGLKVTLICDNTAIKETQCCIGIVFSVCNKYSISSTLYIATLQHRIIVNLSGISI